MNALQKKIMEIYKEIKKICDENNIRYYAIGGTAIGAERHNGFIPWDDDIDIAIPNSDIQKFLMCCKKNLPENLKIFNPRESRHSKITWYKIHDSGTSFLEDVTFCFSDNKYGVFVDIMPMCGVPDDIKKYNKKVKLFRVLSQLQRCEFSQLSTKRKIAYCLFKPINSALPDCFWLNKLEKYQYQFDFDKSVKVGYTWTVIKQNTLFEREWFENYYELPFEDSTIRCCSGNKMMLSHQFGDYMSLPPKEEQISNHFAKVIDLNHSYDDYDEKGCLKGEKK